MTSAHYTEADISSNRQATVIACTLFALSAGALIAAVVSGQLQGQRLKTAASLDQCVKAVLPTTKHRVNRDRVLLLDAKGKTTARIGLLPAVSHDRLQPAMRPQAETIRTRCGPLAQIYTA